MVEETRQYLFGGNSKQGITSAGHTQALDMRPGRTFLSLQAYSSTGTEGITVRPKAPLAPGRSTAPGGIVLHIGDPPVILTGRAAEAAWEAISRGAGETTILVWIEGYYPDGNP